MFFHKSYLETKVHNYINTVVIKIIFKRVEALTWVWHSTHPWFARYNISWQIQSTTYGKGQSPTWVRCSAHLRFARYIPVDLIFCVHQVPYTFKNHFISIHMRSDPQIPMHLTLHARHASGHKRDHNHT